MNTRIPLFLTSLFLAACGSYGTSYPKPTYAYDPLPEDPEFFFESDFGRDTQFVAKLDGATDQHGCMAGGKTVGYLQKPDSYFRVSGAKGPWKISAPAGRPLLISGYWWTYGSTMTTPMAYGGSMTTTTRGRSCEQQVKLVTPVKGGKYLVRLSDAGQRACRLSITRLDGSEAEEVREASACMAR